MNCLRTGLIALTFANGIVTSIAAQTSATSANSSFTGSRAGVSQGMQKGVTVNLPVTMNAAPIPKADNQDSLIVSITQDGSVYLGVNRINTAELTEKVKGALSNRAEKTLYIKADSRAPYASLVSVLDLVRTAGVEKLTFLTSQRDSEQPGAMVPPKGLEMLPVSPRR